MDSFLIYSLKTIGECFLTTIDTHNINHFIKVSSLYSKSAQLIISAAKKKNWEETISDTESNQIKADQALVMFKRWIMHAIHWINHYPALVLSCSNNG